MFIRCSNGQKCKQKKNGFEECVCNSINNFETTFGRKKKKALKCLLYVRQHWIWSDPSIIIAGLQRHGRKEKMKMMHFLFSISVKYLHHWNRQLLNNGYAANFMCMCESSIENAFRWTWLTNKQNNRKILKKSTNNALENITKGKNERTNKQIYFEHFTKKINLIVYIRHWEKYTVLFAEEIQMTEISFFAPKCKSICIRMR